MQFVCNYENKSHSSTVPDGIEKNVLFVRYFSYFWMHNGVYLRAQKRRWWWCVCGRHAYNLQSWLANSISSVIIYECHHPHPLYEILVCRISASIERIIKFCSASFFPLPTTERFSFAFASETHKIFVEGKWNGSRVDDQFQCSFWGSIKKNLVWYMNFKMDQ